MTNANPASDRPLEAVIFDLGGVVLGSPLHAIADYEREIGLAANSVNRVVMETAPTGAWSRLERGELTLDEFFPAFETDCADAGHSIDARRMFELMGEAAKPRPAMLTAIATLRGRGLRVAALTNNWATDSSGDANAEQLRHRFDAFVESSVVGLRKPDPKIYERVCQELRTEAPRCAFLDDIGANLKPARAMGMTTIRVVEPDQALGELERAVGFALRGAA